MPKRCVCRQKWLNEDILSLCRQGIQTSHRPDFEYHIVCVSLDEVKGVQVSLIYTHFGILTKTRHIGYNKVRLLAGSYQDSGECSGKATEP